MDPFDEEKAPPDRCPEAVVTVAIVDKEEVVIRKLDTGEAGRESAPANPRKKMAAVMSWRIQGAESMIQVRVVHINKDRALLWRYRERSERRRISASRLQPMQRSRIKDFSRLHNA